MFSRGIREKIVLISAAQVLCSSSWPSLKSLKDRLVRSNAEIFIERHGGALTLIQFYDYELHYFTFQDYQIVPTLDEYSHLFKITEHILVVILNEHDFETIVMALYLGLSNVR